MTRIATSLQIAALEEGDRQLMLMALAHLSIERPGFDYALNLLALKFDHDVEERAELYDRFRKLRADDALTPAEKAEGIPLRWALRRREDVERFATWYADRVTQTTAPATDYENYRQEVLTAFKEPG